MKKEEIKKMWLNGRNRTAISKELKIPFNKVKQAIIDMGIEDAERKIHKERRLKTIKKEVYENIWIPERKLWIVSSSQKESDKIRKKYNIT